MSLDTGLTGAMDSTEDGSEQKSPEDIAKKNKEEEERKARMSVLTCGAFAAF